MSVQRLRKQARTPMKVPDFGTPDMPMGGGLDLGLDFDARIRPR